MNKENESSDETKGTSFSIASFDSFSCISDSSCLKLSFSFFSVAMRMESSLSWPSKFDPAL